MQIDVTNELPQLNERLKGVYDHLNGDLTPLMEHIGGIVENSTRQRFYDEESPDGRGWEQLADSTINSKNSNGILKSSSHLMNSITYHTYKTSVVVGTPELYGKYHQTGTDPYIIEPKTQKALKTPYGVFKKVHHTGLPARPFLGLSEDDKDDILDALNHFIEEVWRG